MILRSISVIINSYSSAFISENNSHSHRPRVPRRIPEVDTDAASISHYRRPRPIPTSDAESNPSMKLVAFTHRIYSDKISDNFLYRTISSAPRIPMGGLSEPPEFQSRSSVCKRYKSCLWSWTTENKTAITARLGPIVLL